MYETHITIDPVTDPARLKDLLFIASQFDFKVAELLMKKEGDELVPSTLDSFLTGHDTSFPVARNLMINLVSCLQDANFTVRRYKIECIILDSKYQNDPESLL